MTLLHYFFDLTSLEARAEILEKISLVFWKIWRYQKDILKLTDLTKYQNKGSLWKGFKNFHQLSSISHSPSIDSIPFFFLYSFKDSSFNQPWQDQGKMGALSITSKVLLITPFFSLPNLLVVSKSGLATSIQILDIWWSSLAIMNDFKHISRKAFFLFGEINK